MVSWIKKNWSYSIICFFVLIVVIYVGTSKDNIIIPVHDNLDFNIAWFKILKENDLFWKLNVEIPFLGGINRDYLWCSDLKLYTWLYMLLPVFYAYIAGLILKIVISVFGSIWLGRILTGEKYEEYEHIIVLCGFLYGIIPNYPTSALSFASLPVCLSLLILIYRTNNKKYLLCLFLFPILSDFVFFGPFICGYTLLFFFGEWIYTRKPKWQMLMAVMALSAGYFITEYRLFMVMLFSGEPSIRVAWGVPNASFAVIRQEIWKGFSLGHYHSGDVHNELIYQVCCFYFIFLNIYYLLAKKFKNCFSDIFNWLFFLIIVNSVMYGLDLYGPFRVFIAKVVSPLKGFSFARALWSNGFLWYFCFAVVLCRFSEALKVDWRIKQYFLHIEANLPVKQIGYIFIGAAFWVICRDNSVYNHLSQNIRYQKWRISHPNEISQQLTYREFYSENLFEKIKKEIGYNKEYSVAFGMFPSILEYNNIATLDGYLSIYSQHYKEQFRKLIAPELRDDVNNRRYFDGWGARAYIFSKEVTYQPVRKFKKNEANLFIDMNVFIEMGGRYIFSRVKVKNAEELGLALRGVFTDNASPYEIYVYDVYGI